LAWEHNILHIKKEKEGDKSKGAGTYSIKDKTPIAKAQPGKALWGLDVNLKKNASRHPAPDWKEEDKNECAWKKVKEKGEFKKPKNGNSPEVTYGVGRAKRGRL